LTEYAESAKNKGFHFIKTLIKQNNEIEVVMECETGVEFLNEIKNESGENSREIQ